MSSDNMIEKYLPLSESTYYILLVDGRSKTILWITSTSFTTKILFINFYM